MLALRLVLSKMSYYLDIHLWWSEEPDFFQKLAQAILCLPIESLTRLRVMALGFDFDLQGVPSEYPVPVRPRRIPTITAAPGTTSGLAGKDISRNQIEAAIDKLRIFDLGKAWIEAETSFPLLTFDPFSDSLNDESIELTVILDREDFQNWPEQKMNGQIRIRFAGVRRFISPEYQCLYQFNKMPSSRETEQDVSRRMEMAGQIRRNYEIIWSIARELISRVDPAHIVVCADEVVHQLIAYTVYHRNWKHYLWDLRKIVQLHENGGVYFRDVGQGRPDFMFPHKDRGYGDYRSKRRDESKLKRRLHPFVEAILKDQRPVELSKDEIEECLISSLDDVVVEQINDTYMISSKDAPHSYLEEPYFRLFEQALGNQ